MSSSKLMGAVFGPKAIRKIAARTKAPPTAFTIKIPTLVLPKDITEEGKLAIGVAMMAAGTSESKDLESWKSWLASYVALVTPSLVGQLPREIYTPITIPDRVVSTITEGVSTFFTLLSTLESDPPEDAVNAFCTSLALPGLPLPNHTLRWANAYGEAHPKVIICHFSILLFIAGKRIEGDKHVALTQNRPKALKDKAHFKGTIGFLDGDLRMSNNSHLMINNAWAESSPLRAVCFTEYAKYTQADNDVTQDLIYTTMHLLRYSGMQHAKITYGFLSTYPWAAELPALRAPVATYMESVRAAGEYDLSIQPYVKLIYQDKAGIFPRNELEPLVACALKDAEETNPTLVDFYSSNDYSAIVDAFLREKERRERPSAHVGVQSVDTPDEEDMEDEVVEETEDEAAMIDT